MAGMIGVRALHNSTPPSAGTKLRVSKIADLKIDIPHKGMRKF